MGDIELLYSLLVTCWDPWVGPCMVCLLVAYLDGGLWDCAIDVDDE